MNSYWGNILQTRGHFYLCQKVIHSYMNNKWLLFDALFKEWLNIL